MDNARIYIKNLSVQTGLGDFIFIHSFNFLHNRKTFIFEERAAVMACFFCGWKGLHHIGVSALTIDPLINIVNITRPRPGG